MYTGRHGRNAMTRAPLRPETALLHQPHWPASAFDAVQPGVFRASTVFFPDAASWRRRDWLAKDAFVYGPQGTPTTSELEARIAQLEGAEHSLLCPSGLNALALVYLTFLAPGDEVLVPSNVCFAHRRLLAGPLAAWGLRAVTYDPLQPESIPFSPATALLWLEAPLSLTMEFPDVPAIAAAAHGAGVPIALDDTWSAGVAYSAFELGVDLSVQSLGKYANGAADLVMGSICTRDNALYEALKLRALAFGLNVSPSDAADVLRGLQTLPLRYVAQDQRARRLAGWLRDQPAIADVLHPALPGSVGHASWQRDCRAAAGLFSMVFREGIDTAAVDRFLDALRIFRIGFSWGGPISLVLPCGGELANPSAVRGELVRVSVGLEAVEDLLEDLRQALCLLQLGR